MAAKPPLPDKNPESGPGLSKGVLWLILLALLIWNLLTFLPRTRPEVNIPYTAFLAQVRAGNVKDVRIRGAAISGTFGAPVVWPPEKKPGPAPAATPSTTRPPGAAASASPPAPT
ncbi:MAG: ATP-dependent metallopeptidase FtsH/Yme1/Tma family protein, partial [Acidithiobacillales bacterium]